MMAVSEKINKIKVSTIDILICASIIILSCSLYWQVSGHEFLSFDDLSYITQNTYIHKGITFSSLKWAFTTLDPYWHPMTWISLMVDCQLFGLSSGGHHLSNLIYHIVNSLLVFVFFRIVTGEIWKSGFIACVFALHPLNVESVAWAAERKNVLSTGFWMLTLISYSFYARSPGIKKYVTVFILFCMGLMAKPMLVTLPFVFLLLDYWPLGRISFDDTRAGSQQDAFFGFRKEQMIRLFVEKIPFIILSFFVVFMTSFSVEDQNTDVSMDLVPFNVRFANVFVSYVKYIIKLFWPVNLAVFYPFPQKISHWEFFLCFIVVIGITGLVLFYFRRFPYLATGWFWYLGALVPVIGLKQTGLWPAMADRWGYVPLIGIYIVIVFGFSDLFKKNQYRSTIFSVIIFIIFLLILPTTFHQIKYWKNSKTLFSHAVEATENNATAHNNLGVSLLNEGDVETAIDHFKKAIEINPSWEDAHYNLATAFEKTGNFSSALTHYKKALEIDPDFILAYTSLGLFWGRQHQYDKAFINFSKVLDLDPGSYLAYNYIGLVYEMKKQFEEAEKSYLKAIHIKPDFVKPYQGLGILYEKMNRRDDAKKYYMRALELEPESADIHNRLGVLLAVERDFLRALNHFSMAVRIQPEFKAAQENYENVSVQMKNNNKQL